VGLTGIPVINVNNNCSTGSTALFLARQAVESGAVECVLALGFEQMQPGRHQGAVVDRPSPFERFDSAGRRTRATTPRGAARSAAFRRRRAQGSTCAVRHRPTPSPASRSRPASTRPATRWPCSARPVTLDEVMASPDVFGPLTRLQCCPPTCGAAAAVVCSAAFAKRHGLDRACASRPRP
jgi:acetyl-CoA acetyltransferase